MNDATDTIRRKAGWLCLVAAVVTFVSNIPGMCRFVEAVDWNMGWLRERGFSGNGPHADDFRELAERHVPSGEPLYYCVTSREGAFSPAGRWMPCLLAAVGPSLAWHLFAHSQGAVFYDYAPLWRPSLARFFEALRCIVTTAFLRPWKFGFAYPVVGLLVIVAILDGLRHSACRVGREAFVSAGMALLCIPVFALVYSYSRAPDFEWHIRTSVDRLLWCSAVMVAVFGFKVRGETPSADQQDAFT